MQRESIGGRSVHCNAVPDACETIPGIDWKVLFRVRLLLSEQWQTL